MYMANVPRQDRFPYFGQPPRGQIDRGLKVDEGPEDAAFERPCANPSRLASHRFAADPVASH
jgi:hypothetical protein